MNTLVKSGLTAAVVGLGIIASGGSAYAAGCLSPSQTSQSLIEESDSIQDTVTAADASGFRCNVVATEQSVRQPGARVKAVHSVAPATAATKYMPLSIMGGN